jgi:CheY-like chemotaxis protein
VLVLDGEAPVREAMVHLLRSYGIASWTVGTEADAVAALKTSVEALSPCTLLITGETVPERLQHACVKPACLCCSSQWPEAAHEGDNSLIVRLLAAGLMRRHVGCPADMHDNPY